MVTAVETTDPINIGSVDQGIFKAILFYMYSEINLLLFKVY